MLSVLASPAEVAIKSFRESNSTPTKFILGGGERGKKKLG